METKEQNDKDSLNDIFNGRSWFQVTGSSPKPWTNLYNGDEAAKQARN